MSDTRRHTLTLTQERDYRMRVDLGDGVPALMVDEPEPLGSGTGPSPVQLLSSAVASCLTASLLFAFRKFKQEPGPLHAEVSAEVGRNEAGRTRVLRIDALVRLGVPAAQLQHVDRVLAQFEPFCTVTQSIAQGLPVHVQVADADGTLLKS